MTSHRFDEAQLSPVRSYGDTEAFTITIARLNYLP